MSEIISSKDYYIMLDGDKRRKLFNKYCEDCEYCGLGEYNFVCKNPKYFNQIIYDIPPCMEMKVIIEERK